MSLGALVIQPKVQGDICLKSQLRRCRALAIVATYNERQCLPLLLKEMMSLPAGLDALVVDDNSPDDTGALAERLAKANARIHVRDRTQKSEFAAALNDGFRWAIEHGYSLVVNVDADLSHDPGVIPLLMRNATEPVDGGTESAGRSAELVIGSRFLGSGQIVNLPWRRLVLSLAASRYVCAITGMPLLDPTSGFRCFSRRALECALAEPLLSKGYSVHIEMAHRIWMAEMRIVEVPITYRQRQHGQRNGNQVASK